MLLSEIVKAGGEADRKEVLSEVQDPGGTGETDGTHELAVFGSDGSETDRMNAPLEVHDPGGTGEADGTNELMVIMARLIGWKQSGAFKMATISSPGRVLAYRAFLRGYAAGVFF